ncbi:MAG TPA: YfhO family protein [Candidatus Acidoferrales bacterium]|nr:YfhO family protein [Candidatus Acidoferrales bacterium]
MKTAATDSRERQRDLVAVLAIACTAVSFVFGAMWSRAQSGVGDPSTDVYAAHYPNIVYALRQLHLGYGLLWNDLQNCGQPFLPSTLLGLFWPLHVLFLFLDPNRVYFVAAAAHLALGGIGTYLLCQVLNCSRIASFCGAVAFALGGSAIHMAVWVPTTILATYACLPWAVYAGEIVLQRPTVRSAALLGTVLSLQVFSGYPQINWFTYLILGLRFAWELASADLPEPRRTAAAFAVGLALPLLLAGIQLYPMIDMASESVRNVELTAKTRSPFGVFTWEAFRRLLGMRAFAAGIGATLALIPVALAPIGLVGRPHLRVTLFYLGIGALFLSMAFDSRVSDLLRALPLGRSFRFPERSLWGVGFASNVCVGLGVDGLRRAAASKQRRLMSGLAMLAGVAGFYFLSPSGLTQYELYLLASLTIAVGLAFVGPSASRFALWVVPVVLVVNLLLISQHTELRLMTDAKALSGQSAAFDVARQRVTRQDRIYIIGQNLDFSLIVKAASIFSVPSMDDYEPQTSQRYAELFVRMLYDVPMMSINMHVFRLRQVPANRALFDLTAARFVVADTRARGNISGAMQPPLSPLWENGPVVVFENPQALPRAFFVPRLEVEPDPAQLLNRLASAPHDPRQVALVEAMPGDGFLGNSTTASGKVEIVDDRSEDLVLSVQASDEGFLSVQDQLYPGWSATVNDKPVEILRSNYAFRAVRVPAGESRVVFRYRPWSVRLGSAATLAGLLLVVAVWRSGPTSRRKRGGQAAVLICSAGKAGSQT